MLKVEEKPLLLLIEDDLDTLMHAHWRECATAQSDVPLDPDWSYALGQEKAGAFSIFALTDDDALVGYAAFEIATPLLFKSTLHAFNIGIYVKPECRRGNAGLKLFTESQRLLTEKGVRRICYSTPYTSNLNAILAKDGYEASEAFQSKMVA